MDINTSIGVHDAFSEPLRNMTNALNMTISSFETMQDISGEAVDIRGLQQARDELAKAELGFDNVGKEINQSAENQKQFNREINKANDSANNLYSTFKRVAAVIGISKMFKEGFDIYREFNLEMANLEAVTLATKEQMEALHYTAKNMGETTIFSAGESAAAMTELAKGGLQVYEIVEGIPHVLNLSAASGMELAKSAGITVDIMRGFNLEASEMERVVDLIAYTSSNSTTEIAEMGEAFAYSAKIADTFNASIEETTALIGMMSSAAKGSMAGTALRRGFGNLADPSKDAQEWADRLSVDFIDPTTNEIRSITGIVDDLADAFEGLTSAQQIQASKSIFGEQGYNAWLAVIQQGQGAMDEWLVAFDEQAVGTADKMKNIMLSTTDGVLQLHKSEVSSIWISFYEGLADGVVGEALLSVLSAMRTTLEIGLNLITGAFTVVGYGIELIANNLDFIIPIVLTFAGVWAVLNAQLFLNAGATLLAIGKNALLHIQTVITTIGLMLQATATFFLTWAVHGLNAALMATPLGWVIAGIMILVGGLFLGVAAFNRLAGTSVSAMGIIGGVIGVTVAFIGNLFVAFINFTIDSFVVLWNFIGAFANFFANVFNDPVGAIARLFFDLVDTILSLLQRLASAIDTIFGSNLSGAVQGWRDSLGGWVDDKFGQGVEVMAKMSGSDMHLGRFEYGAAWDSGYNIGEGIGEGMSDMFSFDNKDFDMDSLMNDFDMGDMGNIDDSLSGPGGINDTLGDISKSTKGIDDKMSATEEDIKYLRDLASSRILSRLTNNEFKIDIVNNNKIDSQMDLDGVINDMADGLEEQFNIAMEG